MEEFTMSAFARYADGSSGAAFAEVSAHSLVVCFGAMAAEVAGWLPRALAGDGGEDPPRAIELKLEWSGAPASVPGPDGSEAPSGSAQRNVRPPRPRLRCAARRRLGRAGSAALPLLPSAYAGLTRSSA